MDLNLGSTSNTACIRCISTVCIQESKQRIYLYCVCKLYFRGVSLRHIHTQYIYAQLVYAIYTACINTVFNDLYTAYLWRIYDLCMANTYTCVACIERIDVVHTPHIYAIYTLLYTPYIRSRISP